MSLGPDDIHAPSRGHSPFTGAEPEFIPGQWASFDDDAWAKDALNNALSVRLRSPLRVTRLDD